MTLDGAYLKRSPEEGRGGDQKFYFHDCPFFPRNTLRSMKQFVDDHTYRYYNINVRNKEFNYHRDKLDRIITDEDNENVERDDINKNGIHIYHYKHYNKNIKREKEINTKSRSNDFASKTHEREENSINHGRGKEKLLNPRKNMCDPMGSKNRYGGNHSFCMNKEELTTDRKCSNVSKNDDAFCAEINDPFEIHDGNDFTLSAQITLTSDIPQQKSYEHPPRLEKIVDCKHDYHSLTFPNEEYHTTFIKNEIVAKDQGIQPVSSNQYEDINKAMESHRDFVMLQLQEAEEIKKLFSDKNNGKSSIKDIYEEEQFLYDPQSRQVSHIVLAKSRSCNFLEYFKTTNKLNEHNLPLPTKDIQLLGNQSLNAILPIQPSTESEMLSREKQTLVKTVLPLESGPTFQDMKTQLNRKDLMPTEKILIIERKKSLPSNTVSNDSVKYLKVEDCTPQEFQTFNAEKSFEQKKSVTLPPIHKRPELQKRYFYNEFKTYKRKYSEDDLLYADQVKSTKDKFEKIFSKIISRKRAYSTLNNNKICSSKENIIEKDCNTESLKRSQRFLSEDNICLRKSEEGRNLLNDTTCRTEKINEPISKQTRNSSFYRSLMKIKFSPQKKDTEDTDQPKFKNQTLKKNCKMASMDNLCTIETGNFSTKDERYKTKEDKTLSDNKHSRDNSAQMNKSSDMLQKNVEVITGHGNVQNTDTGKTNHGKVQIQDDDKVEHGKVQAIDDKRSISIINGNEAQINKKLIRGSPQPEKFVKFQKKEKSPDRLLVNKVRDESKSPSLLTDSKPESDKRYPSDSYYKQNVIDEIYRRDSDTLESFGRPVSEEVLIKIRECGTSITYFGGRVINRKYGPMCSPMTMTILNEIKQYMSVLNEHFHKPRDEGRKI